ncbi:MAG: hypothetical protein ACREDD_08485 [Methylocella sp.]
MDERPKRYKSPVQIFATPHAAGPAGLASERLQYRLKQFGRLIGCEPAITLALKERLYLP